MTYNEITSIIRDAAGLAFTALGLNNGFFLNAAGSSFMQRRVDLSAVPQEKFPQVALFYLQKNSDLKASTVVWNCFMVFLDQDNPGSPISQDDTNTGTIETVESIVSRMEVLANEFVKQMDDYRGFEITLPIGTPEIRTLATTLTGWGIKFNVTGFSAC